MQNPLRFAARHRRRIYQLLDVRTDLKWVVICFF